MTPKQLENYIKLLETKGTHTTKYVSELASIGMWNYEKEAKKTYGIDQKKHWTGWLSEQNGPGAYGRKGDAVKEARSVYNRIMCPPMLVWLAEAVGIKKTVIQSAVSEALKPKKPFASQCATIRRIIPWEEIESKLESK
jgi:hypothetical protein